MSETKEKNRPVETINMGTLSASVWQTQTQYGPRFHATFDRSYFNDGTWHRTRGFGKDHLMDLSKLVDMAHTKILALRAEHREVNGTKKTANQSRDDKQRT